MEYEENEAFVVITNDEGHRIAYWKHKTAADSYVAAIQDENGLAIVEGALSDLPLESELDDGWQLIQDNRELG